MPAQRDKFNPTGYANVPILGQPKTDYGIGLGFQIPDDPQFVEALKLSVAEMDVKKEKGDIVIILGIPPKRLKCFGYEEFLELIFGKPSDAEAATGGKDNES